MVWISSGAIFIFSLIFFAWYRHRVQKELERISRAHARAITHIKGEEVARLERLTREHDTLKEDKVHDLVEELASPLDAFEEAIAFADGELKLGLESVRGNLVQAFHRQNIEPIDPVAGDGFLPKYHEAISSLASNQIERGKIVACLRIGWKAGDKCVRPAMVSVSAGISSVDSVENDVE